MKRFLFFMGIVSTLFSGCNDSAPSDTSIEPVVRKAPPHSNESPPQESDPQEPEVPTDLGGTNLPPPEK